MRNITWYANRLKTMNLCEILWRLQQKSLQNWEKRQYWKKRQAVYEITLPKKLLKLVPQVDRISINWENEKYSIFMGQDIFGVYLYQDYKKKWNAGFQTENDWPVDQCSYDIPISQREDIGDIRTNWELNRHYQFACLAKSFYVTGNVEIIKEIETLFYDWNNKNCFLWGVEWTSAMEIAIRVNSWIYTYCFLEKACKKYNCNKNEILRDLYHGIIVMTNYIVKHRAKYSSANNHLIVEMYAVGMAGLFFDYKHWQKLAVDILTAELPRQNYSDGVNKEMSLHYQSLVMEVYGLLMLELRHNQIKIPCIWLEYLSHMSEFLCDCRGDYGETVVFGDNDEGKILDLTGQYFDHYLYVLNLMSIVLPKKYWESEEFNENLCWIVKPEILSSLKGKACYFSPEVKCYKEGGYTFLRGKGNKVLIGIDHADLGFKSLAAHGHADALSFQLFIEGEPIFVDPGTYNYHVPQNVRNEFRATENHNTVCIDGQNQGEIQGPFLWGKRYKKVMPELSDTDKLVRLKMGIEYSGNMHIRTITLYKSDEIIVDFFDEIRFSQKPKKIEQIFVFGPDCDVKAPGARCGGFILKIDSTAKMDVKTQNYSSAYNKKKQTKKYIYSISNMEKNEVAIKTRLMVKEKNENIKY